MVGSCILNALPCSGTNVQLKDMTDIAWRMKVMTDRATIPQLSSQKYFQRIAMKRYDRRQDIKVNYNEKM